MDEVIEVVFEDGVFKPLRSVKVSKGDKLTIIVKDVKENVVEEVLKRFEDGLRRLKPIKVDYDWLEELYYEGKARC